MAQVENVEAAVGEADLEAARFPVLALPSRTAQAAGLACLGSKEARARVVGALASSDETEVQVAQAYLRHRPITDGSELRGAALRIAQMSGTAAQVRAIETLARLHVSDREVLDELARLYARTPSPAVQRAIAEVYLRAGPREVASPELVSLLQKRRLPVRGGPDLVEVLLGRMQGS